MMSRAQPLPDRPNLEHLKKQAKALHRRMQQQDSSCTLTDAQHALAREYGVASWPKLKAHVASLLESTARQRQARASAPAASESSPFAGRWVTDLSRSTRHPLQEFEVAHLDIQIAGEIVTLTDVIVDPSGRKEQHVNTLEVTGEEHPLKYAGYAVTARWCGSHVLQAVVKKDGRLEGRSTYEVSSDGRTLTLRGETETGSHVIVFNRVDA
jgi:Glyoxalase superfamily protein